MKKNIFQTLWQEYSTRVSYAKTYEKMISVAGGQVKNDHIAFRSLRMVVNNKQTLGIDYLEGFFKLLGYQMGGEYFFPETHLYARHYYHPQEKESNLPKLFISELIVDELPENIQELIYQTVKEVNLPGYETENIFIRPWQPPKLSVVEEVNKVTQYGAWILLHGYAVNHFTGYINTQNTPEYPDIDTTAKALAAEGVPMKAVIEGSANIGLRQTATQAIKEMVAVINDVDGSNQEIEIPWTYAYYELAQRYPIEVTPGHQVIFDAFLGRNAKELFEMTKMQNA